MLAQQPWCTHLHKQPMSFTVFCLQVAMMTGVQAMATVITGEGGAMMTGV